MYRKIVLYIVRFQTILMGPLQGVNKVIDPQKLTVYMIRASKRKNFFIIIVSYIKELVSSIIVQYRCLNFQQWPLNPLVHECRIYKYHYQKFYWLKKCKIRDDFAWFWQKIIRMEYITFRLEKTWNFDTPITNYI